MDGPAKLLTQSVLAQSQADPRVGKAKTPDEARRVAEEFEAVFLAQMLKPMFAGISADGPFGGGPAETIYRSLMIDEYAKLIGRSGGVGVADAVQREILKIQETES